MLWIGLCVIFVMSQGFVKVYEGGSEIGLIIEYFGFVIGLSIYFSGDIFGFVGVDKVVIFYFFLEMKCVSCVYMDVCKLILSKVVFCCF